MTGIEQMNTAPFAVPINGVTPCGEDPRYLDEFLAIKEEFDKLSDTNYEQVYQDSATLLTTSCKDIRVATYHLLASVYLHGPEGLLHGLTGYRLIVSNFWSECHPVRDNARLAALGLLNTPRLLAFAEQHRDQLDADILNKIQSETEQINTFLIAQLGDEVPRLSNLAAWCTKQLKFLPAVDEPTLSSQASPVQPVVPSVTPPQPVATINSGRELDIETRKLHSFLCDNNELYQAMALSRAMLWGGQAFPPHDNGQTRVPPPRQSAWSELHKLATSSNPEHALLLSEKIFFEPGFRYNLALQQFVWQHANQHNFTAIVSLVETTTRIYLERYPELIDLSYADTSPFSTTDATLWLEQVTIQQQGGTANQKEQTAREEPELNQAVTSALLLARDKQLPEALLVLRECPSDTALTRLRLQLAEAQSCHVAGKAQLAEVVLADLYQHACKHRLGTWHPQLLMELIELRSKVVQTLLKGTKQESKERLTATMEELQRVACRIDLLAACQFIK